MEWFENETHWETLYPLIFDEKRFISASTEVEHALELAGLCPPAAVLDLGCGPARHALILAQKGFRVTGVDRSPFLLNQARRRIGQAKADIELVQADMREFVRSEQYDLILSLYTSFGYFRTRDEDLSVLRHVRDSLKSGGKFVVETISRDYVAGHCPTRWEELPDGTLSIQHIEAFFNWSRIQIQWLLVKNERVKSFQYEHNVYSSDELRGLLVQAGFRRIHFYGDLSGSVYDEKSANMVALAERNDDSEA
jgi:SAM-dependent methyltransferase